MPRGKNAFRLVLDLFEIFPPLLDKLPIQRRILVRDSSRQISRRRRDEQSIQMRKRIGPLHANYVLPGFELDESFDKPSLRVRIPAPRHFPRGTINRQHSVDE